MVKPHLIIGAGPAGLMAAQTLSEKTDVSIEVYDHMPSAGRKFLQAGKGGLNLTHSLGLKPSSFDQFLAQYPPEMALYLKKWGPRQLWDWAEALGHSLYIGSSGRVFPNERKAGPLLHSWKAYLEERGVKFFFGYHWNGWSPGKVILQGEQQVLEKEYQNLFLALGGCSWPHLGSRGDWTTITDQMGISRSPWKPANCGFEVFPDNSGWSSRFWEKVQEPYLKSVEIRNISDQGPSKKARGDLLLTSTGVEGGPLYALSRDLRREWEKTGSSKIVIDLTPDITKEILEERFGKRPRKKSLTAFLKSHFHWDSTRVALFYEAGPPRDQSPQALAAYIKALPLPLGSPRPLEEAISSAGGIKWEELTRSLMLKKAPGVYTIGEMIDWEAPTGGYLLTGVMSLAHFAAETASSPL